MPGEWMWAGRICERCADQSGAASESWKPHPHSTSAEPGTLTFT